MRLCMTERIFHFFILHVPQIKHFNPCPLSIFSITLPRQHMRSYWSTWTQLSLFSFPLSVSSRSWPSAFWWEKRATHSLNVNSRSPFEITQSIFPVVTELLSRHMEHFWLYHCFGQHHRERGRLAGNKKNMIKHQQALKESVPLWLTKVHSLPLCEGKKKLYTGMNSQKVFLWIYSDKLTSLSTTSKQFPSPLLCPYASLTWVSWSCSEQLVWSNCWDKVTPSEFFCGPLSSPSRLCPMSACSSPCSSSSTPSLECRLGRQTQSLWRWCLICYFTTFVVLW